MKRFQSMGILFLLICHNLYAPMYVEDHATFIDRIDGQKQLLIEDESLEGFGFIYSHEEHWDDHVCEVYKFAKDGKTIELSGQTPLTFFNSLWRKNLCSTRLLLDTFSDAISRRCLGKWALSPDGNYLVALWELSDLCVFDEKPELIEQDAVYVYHFGTKSGQIKKLPGSMAYERDKSNDPILLIAVSSQGSIALATRKAIYTSTFGDAMHRWDGV